MASSAHSPPRARGKRNVRSPLDEADTLTPALAGNTIGWRAGSLGQYAHPRTRGRIPGSPKKPGHSQRSPPRSRGILVPDSCATPLTALTPACVGNTTVNADTDERNNAHPRVRGEYCLVHNPVRPAERSPPRARGIPFGLSSERLFNTLTPAGAGNTSQLAATI